MTRLKLSLLPKDDGEQQCYLSSEQVCMNNITHKIINYTERQKKLITSSERHSLKSKALKLIIIGHILAIVVLT